jgi:CBS domain containing-hemolysin-like protein
MTLAGLLALALLVGLNGCFAALETALSARRSVPVRSRSLPTTQLVITLCSLGLGLLAAPVLAVAIESLARSQPSGPSPAPWSVALALVVVIAVQVVVGELVPKAIAAGRPERVLTVLGAPLRLVEVAAAPAVAAVDLLVRPVSTRLSRSTAGSAPDVADRDELRRMVRRSEASGELTHHDADLLDRTFRFAQKVAADVLTPRVEVHSLALDASVEDLVAASASTGLSRFPVHGSDVDDIVGVVHVKDVLAIDRGARATTAVEQLARPVLAVPTSKDLESLMGELRAQAGQFAVVVDEYGGTAGIVTLEDLLEELVGDIADEHDPAATSTVRRWGGAHMVSGRLHADEVRAACGLELPDGAYETLGGFVMERLGRVPVEGDEFLHDGWSVQVLEMDGHRVRTVRLVAPAPDFLPVPGTDGARRTGGARG